LNTEKMEDDDKD